MEARRLRVPELRDELGRRGLDTRGLKSELAERLQAALDGEGARRDGAEGRCKRRGAGGVRGGREVCWALREGLGARLHSGAGLALRGPAGREPLA